MAAQENSSAIVGPNETNRKNLSHVSTDPLVDSCRLVAIVVVNGSSGGCTGSRASGDSGACGAGIYGAKGGAAGTVGSEGHREDGYAGGSCSEVTAVGCSGGVARGGNDGPKQKAHDRHAQTWH